MKRFHLFLSLVLLLLTSFIPSASLTAQHLTAHRGLIHNGYNFWLYNPDQPTSASNLNSSEKLPLIVFLHGASLCGHNLNNVLRYGTLDALNKGMRLGAYVVAPQNPGGAWKPVKIDEVVDWTLSRYPDIDTTRIYVLGMSLGGYGTIDYAAYASQRVAAAMALCGGGTSRHLANLSRVPLCIMHGTNDRAVSWQCSQQVVDAMVAAGDTSRLIYRLLPRRNHGILAYYFYQPETYQWLFAHALTDSARQVCRDVNLDLSLTHNIFQKLYQERRKLRPIVVDNYQPSHDEAQSHRKSKREGQEAQRALLADNHLTSPDDDPAATPAGKPSRTEKLGIPPASVPEVEAPVRQKKSTKDTPNSKKKEKKSSSQKNVKMSQNNDNGSLYAHNTMPDEWENNEKNASTKNDASSSKSKTSLKKNSQAKNNTTASVGSRVHVTRKGDSLYKIAKKHHTTVAELRQLNHIQGTALKVGQQIRY